MDSQMAQNTSGGSKYIVYVDEEIVDLVPRFLAQRKQDLESIAQLVSDSNWDDVAVIGHNMKGTGRAYGFDFVSDLGGLLERAARAENEARVERLRQRLKDYLDRVQVETE